MAGNYHALHSLDGPGKTSFVAVPANYTVLVELVCLIFLKQAEGHSSIFDSFFFSSKYLASKAKC